ncbi:MAG: NAD(P)-dependent oxidoreductase [Pseudomonadota bacterium]
MERVAFIGLGVMGFPMAGHLASKGHKVSVFNRTRAKAEEWVTKFGNALAESPAEAADGAKIVFSCVGNDDDLRSVLLGPNGAFGALRPGTIFVDHTTVSAEISRELNSLSHAKDGYFIDAPVSGGQAGAENGALTVMCGGDDEPYAQAEPVIASFARSCKLLGPSGSGQLAKMVNQICVAGVVQSLSEALAFAEKAGLDGSAVLDVISKGAAGSWQMENRGETMVKDEFDFGFAVDWMRKDLQICLSEARRNGASLPVTALIDQFYRDVQAMGGGRLDTSSLIKRLR